MRAATILSGRCYLELVGDTLFSTLWVKAHCTLHMNWHIRNVCRKLDRLSKHGTVVDINMDTVVGNPMGVSMMYTGTPDSLHSEISCTGQARRQRVVSHRPVPNKKKNRRQRHFFLVFFVFTTANRRRPKTVGNYKTVSDRVYLSTIQENKCAR